MKQGHIGIDDVLLLEGYGYSSTVRVNVYPPEVTPSGPATPIKTLYSLVIAVVKVESSSPGFESVDCGKPASQETTLVTSGGT